MRDISEVRYASSWKERETIMMISDVQKGRPSDKRIPKEERTYDFIDSLGIEYTRVDHDPADTMEMCAEAKRVLGVGICKNLFLCPRNKSQYYILVMPGDKPFKTKELSSQIGSSRLSFAGEVEMEEFLDITPGSVSVLGLMNDTENRVRLLVDQDLLKEEWFGCHPCINTSSLKLHTSDVFEKIVPATGHDVTVVELKGDE